jgi:hypothetical protein
MATTIAEDIALLEKQHGIVTDPKEITSIHRSDDDHLKAAINLDGLYQL